MSEIQHKSLRDEVLYVIGRATAPLSGPEIYERCELADEMKQVSDALFQLKDAEKIVRVEGEGRARYKLAAGVMAPAPAGKAGRPHVADPDAAPPKAKAPAPARSAARPAAKPSLPVIDIPPPGYAADTQLTEREKGRVEAALHRAEKGSAAPAVLAEPVEAQRSADTRLADAIIARLKRDLAPTLCEMEAASGLDRLNVHVHIEQVDIHLGGL
ncbi:MAG: hypothetical protein M0Z99_00755 [Betaproteobacteria bacterium]|nr:hypothetical protein [Betaproteobacteria bacterium]